MKILSHYIQFLLLLVLPGVVFISCSGDTEDMIEDVPRTEVTFTAMIHESVHTRTSGEGLKVNTLAVGIFNENLEEIGREEFPITASSVNVQLALAKGQTYNLVFWAYNDGCRIYDMENLTAVKMKNDKTVSVTFAQVEKADAFFATVKDFTVTANKTVPVTLTRPLTQINVGTSGMAVPASFTVMNVATTFHPFTETVSMGADFSWTFDETTTAIFTADGRQYTLLATGYLFAPIEEPTQKACKLVLTKTEEEIEFPSVELRANHRSNIVGSFTK